MGQGLDIASLWHQIIKDNYVLITSLTDQSVHKIMTCLQGKKSLFGILHSKPKQQRK